MDIITFPEICKPLVVYRFCCMALFRSQTQRHIIMFLSNIGSILTVESSSIKASEGLFGDNQLDPENPVSTENKKKFRRLTQIIRVYYILGPAANEQIGKAVNI